MNDLVVPHLQSLLSSSLSTIEMDRDMRFHFVANTGLFAAFSVNYRGEIHGSDFIRPIHTG